MKVIFKSLLFISITFAIINKAEAGFIVDASFNYHSDEDDVTTFSYSKLDYRGFLGANLDSKGTFYFGQNISQFGRSFSNNGEEGEYSVLELGPRFQLYFGPDGPFYLGFAWNPYVNGTRQVSGTEVDISGSSYFVNLGFQVKLSRAFKIGASLNYHSISITKETDSDNVETEVTNAYTNIYPMIELSLRFR